MKAPQLRRCIIILLLVGLVSACGPKNVVVLVPDPDGSVGSITVANDAGSVEIDTANESTTIRNAETAPTAPVEMGAKDIDNIFGGHMPEYIDLSVRMKDRARIALLDMCPGDVADQPRSV